MTNNDDTKLTVTSRFMTFSAYETAHDVYLIIAFIPWVNNMKITVSGRI